MNTTNNSNIIVVKVGTSTLTYDGGGINIRRVEKLVKVLSDIKNSGKKVILVSSGAIGIGMGKLGISKRPECTRDKQALAAIGQCELMNYYSKLFGEYNHNVAQILLTKDVVSDPVRNENAANTFEKLLQLGIIPIVNENDTVSTEQIEFGDNDTLSATVACLAKASLLIILSDIDGLYDADPRADKNAKLIERIDKIDESIEALAGGAGTSRGTGGMITKIHAAEAATRAGIDMIIANGADPEILYDITDGKSVGTLFKA
ncbi:MAG: glutamate 5-kinase [Ruminococcaceae bacterium]|nr:glutamate 5-kinase [Oscillospiraceae bacterium]